MDCVSKGIFETPIIVSQTSVNTLWMNSFGSIPYIRVEVSSPYGIGIGMSDFGNEIYKENEFAIAYTREIKIFKLGVSMQGMKIHTDEYENVAFGCGAGVSFNFKDYVDCNLTVQNLNSPKLNNETVSRTISGYLSIYPIKEVQTNVDFLYIYDYPIELRLMNKIKFSESFFGNIGVNNYPASLVFGVDLFYGKFGLSYYTRTHKELGMTHILMMSFYSRRR